MNIKQLEVFAAIAETGSFSRGAEASFITQSTASQHIAALEESAGVRLLDRTGRGAVPTAAGKILLGHAHQVLASLRQAEQALRQFRTMEGAELHIACSSIPGTYLLPEVVAILRTAAPGITVTAEIGDSGEALALLRNEAVEFALVGSVPDDPLFEVAHAGNDTVRLVVPPGHPWGDSRKIHPAELTSEPLIMRRSGSGTGRAVAEALRVVGLDAGQLRHGALFSTSEAVKQAALAGCGAAFISEAAVAGERARGELIVVEIEGVRIERPLFLVWRRGRSLSPAAEKFRRVVLAAATGNGAHNAVAAAA